MPIVTVQQSPRDVDAKRRLVAGVTEAFVDAYGVRAEQVQVFIGDNPEMRGDEARSVAAFRAVPLSSRFP